MSYECLSTNDFVGRNEGNVKGRREEKIGKKIKRGQKERRLKTKKITEGRKERYKEGNKLTRKKQRNQFKK